MVQRYEEYTYKQGELRGIVGEVRKQMDVPLQVLASTCLQHVDVNDSVQVLNGGYIVICWLLVFS
jgi:hypothetical protein